MRRKRLELHSHEHRTPGLPPLSTSHLHYAGMMLLGSYAVTLVHMVSGGMVMLLNGAALAAKRGADLHVAKREELLLGKCCCFSDDSSLCAAASGAAVVVFDVLAHASPQATPTCTELGTVTLGAEATHAALGPSVAGGARYALACDAAGACYFWRVTVGGGTAGTAGTPPAARKVAAWPAEALLCACFTAGDGAVLGGSCGLRLWRIPAEGEAEEPPPPYPAAPAAPAAPATAGAVPAAAVAVAGAPVHVSAFAGAGRVVRCSYAAGPTPRVLSCADDGRVLLWDAASGARLVELGRHEAPPHATWLADGGRWLLTLCGRSSLRVFDSYSGAQLALPAFSGFSVHLWASAALSPDSRWVLGLGVSRMGAWEVMAIEVPELVMPGWRATPPLEAINRVTD